MVLVDVGVGRCGSWSCRSSWSGRCLAVCATAAFVDGRGSRRAAGRTPPAGAGVPAASGSRPWCRRRGGTVGPWRPARGWWPGRRRAAPRTGRAVPRSAGPRSGRARSPPDHCIEHMFGSESGTLHSPPGPRTAWVGRRWGRNSAAPPRTSGDDERRGQRPFDSVHLERETAGVSFHTG
jgi:hypothetical protein